MAAVNEIMREQAFKEYRSFLLELKHRISIDPENVKVGKWEYEQLSKDSYVIVYDGIIVFAYLIDNYQGRNNRIIVTGHNFTDIDDEDIINEYSNHFRVTKVIW